jgi:dihydroneopterin aldolase
MPESLAPHASSEACQDRIELRGLRFMGAHGVLPEEAERAQFFEVDLDLLADLSTAGSSDDLADTIDYSSVCDAVRSVVEGPHVALLERLAQLVADDVLAATGGRAQGVVVTVRKLRPPLPVQITSAAVRIHRP